MLTENMPSETAYRRFRRISRSNLFFPVKHHRLHRRSRQAFGQRQHRHQPHGKRIFQYRLPAQPTQGGTAQQQLENPSHRRRRTSRHARTETARNGNAAASSSYTPASSGLPTRPGSKTQTRHTQTTPRHPSLPASRIRRPTPTPAAPSVRTQMPRHHAPTVRTAASKTPTLQTKPHRDISRSHTSPTLLTKQTALYRAKLCQQPEKLQKQPFIYIITKKAGVAQSVEQRIRNAKVGGSIPFSGTNTKHRPSLPREACAFSHFRFRRQPI